MASLGEIDSEFGIAGNLELLVRGVAKDGRIGVNAY
jgi:hypothetical protein